MARIACVRWAVPLLAALLLAGCGAQTEAARETVPKPLSQVRLSYLANTACRRFERRLRRHGKPKSTIVALKDFQEFYVPAYEHLLFKLNGLTPPPSDAKAFRRLRATFNNEDLIINHFLLAVDNGQIQRAKMLAIRIKRQGWRLNARAARLGLHTCAGK